MVWTQVSCHKYVNYDHLGECSPEKDCMRWHLLMFRQPERKSSSESSHLHSRVTFTVKSPSESSRLQSQVIFRVESSSESSHLQSQVIFTVKSSSESRLDDLTLKMTSLRLSKRRSMSPQNSPSQDNTHPDDHNLRTYDDSTLCNVQLPRWSTFCFVCVSVGVLGWVNVIFGIFTALELRYATEVNVIIMIR